MPLTDGQIAHLRVLSEDYTYLLMPQPWETNSEEMVWMLGQYLAERRRGIGLQQSRMGARIGEPLDHMRTMEGIKRYSGAPFTAYLRYVRAFDLTFQRIFTEVGQTTHHYHQDFLKRRERQLTAAAKRALATFAADGRDIHAAAIAEHIGVSRATLWRYPRIWKLVARARQRHQADRKQ